MRVTQKQLRACRVNATLTGGNPVPESDRCTDCHSDATACNICGHGQSAHDRIPHTEIWYCRLCDPRKPYFSVRYAPFCERPTFEEAVTHQIITKVHPNDRLEPYEYEDVVLCSNCSENRLVR